MKRILLAGAVALFVVLNFGAATPEAKAAYYRSYYSRVTYTHSYSYRQYHYYSPAYQTYRYHVAVYYPARPNYVYYYNPYSGRYWGRYDINAGGYSLLAENDRSTLCDIPESAFPKPGKMPTQEKGGEIMLPPPEAVK